MAIELCVRAILIASLGLLAGCDSLADVQGAWEEKLRRILLPGAADFRAEYDLTESGVMVFSYTAPEASIAHVKAHIAGLYPSYSAVEESAVSLTLRSVGSGARFEDLEELRFRIDPATGRMYGLAMRQVPPRVDRYEELSSALEAVLPGRH